MCDVSIRRNRVSRVKSKHFSCSNTSWSVCSLYQRVYLDCSGTLGNEVQLYLISRWHLGLPIILKFHQTDFSAVWFNIITRLLSTTVVLVHTLCTVDGSALDWTYWALHVHYCIMFTCTCVTFIVCSAWQNVWRSIFMRVHSLCWLPVHSVVTSCSLWTTADATFL